MILFRIRLTNNKLNKDNNKAKLNDENLHNKAKSQSGNNKIALNHLKTFHSVIYTAICGEYV